MRLVFSEDFGERRPSDLLVLPFWQEEKRVVPACPMREFEALCKPSLASGDFLGKEGETVVIYRPGKKEDRYLLLGLGKKAECTHETVRRAYASAVKFSHKKKLKEISVALPEAEIPSAVAAVEGLLLTNYVFEAFKEKPVEPLQKACLIGISEIVFQACKRAAQVVEAVNFTRDLTNGNADDITPEYLASTARRLQKEYALVKTTVFDRKRIEKEKMGLLLAVSRGAEVDPSFIIVEYRGNPDTKDLTAILGKGITYDTGGLNIKTTGMETMKDDMSGGAVVLGTIKAAASLKLPVNLVGVIASAENAIGPKSYKPGDVYRSYSGKTVEISNTDAEGRLVLADALSYVQDQYKPSRIIDFATLTGGVVVALGEEAAGLFCNDDALAQRLEAAGKNTAELVWRLPIFPEYREPLKSDIADIKNSGDRKGHAIQGAMFLADFVRKTPWAHIDIAGTAYLSKPRRYHSTPATGIGVRLMIEFLSAIQS